jgi:hypothetical protein
MSAAAVTTSRAIEPTAIYTAPEAARLLSMSPRYITTKLNLGVIKGSRRIGTWRVRGSELIRAAG